MPAKTALRGCRHDRPQTSGRACRPSNRSETNKRQQGRTCAEGTTPWEDGVKGVCPPDRPATRRQAGSTDIAPGCMGRCKQYGDARWGNEGCADSGRGAGGGGGTLQLLLPQQSALPMPVQPEYFDVPVAERPSSGPAPPPPVMPPSPPSLPPAAAPHFAPPPGTPPQAASLAPPPTAAQTTLSNRWCTAGCPRHCGPGRPPRRRR